MGYVDFSSSAAALLTTLPNSPPLSPNLSPNLPILRSCGRITPTQPNPTWRTELMLSPLVMGDCLLLTNTDVLILNGARRGTVGWYWATEPNPQPLLYHPRNRRRTRFQPLTPTTIPRMYHSSSAVLPDTSILVAGSNPIPVYNTTLGSDNPFPTEVRLEKFHPPYFNPSFDPQRPTLISSGAPSDVKYGQAFALEFTVTANITAGDVDLKVTMYTPPFTTHAVSMNKRLLILRMKGWESVGENRYRVTVFAPAGYYMTFVVNHGVPSHAVWIKVHK